jgi:hypothetical protein
MQPSASGETQRVDNDFHTFATLDLLNGLNPYGLQCFMIQFLGILFFHPSYRSRAEQNLLTFYKLISN